ncbi:MAG: hypothetical protein V4537_14450 [Pseudomonadota bacterium]
MPSDYVGDETATQAPSAPPTPGARPTVHQPSDGDALNAASVLQDFKVLADFEAWLMNPRSRAGGAGLDAIWAESQRRYKDARLRDRFTLNHFGLPSGEYIEWRERFGRRTDWAITGPGTPSVREWDLLSEGAGSTLSVQNCFVGAGTNFSNTHSSLKFDLDDAAANRQSMRLADDANTMIWSDDMLAVLDYEWVSHVVTDATWVHGICGQGEAINTIQNGAFFIRANSPGAHWHARTIQGGTSTDTDTGVTGTADAVHHFAIATVGANVGDDSTKRTLFFVDGVIKANHIANMPASSQMQPIFGGFAGGGAAGNQSAILGPPHWVQITRSSTP